MVHISEGYVCKSEKDSRKGEKRVCKEGCRVMASVLSHVGAEAVVLNATPHSLAYRTFTTLLVLVLGWLKAFFATPHELMLACSAILSLVQSALKVEHSGLHFGSCIQAWTEIIMARMMIVLMLILKKYAKDSQFCNGSEFLFLCTDRRWDSQPLSLAPRGRPWQRRSR